MEDPVQIYQAHLDTVSALFWSGRFDEAMQFMTFPGFMETRDARIDYDRPDQLMRSGRAMRESLINQGAQAYHRVCTDAAFVCADKTRILGRHTTYVLRGGSYVIDPYLSEMRLLLEQGVWKGNGIRSEIALATSSMISPAQLRRDDTDQHLKPSAGGRR